MYMNDQKYIFFNNSKNIHIWILHKEQNFSELNDFPK